MVKIGNVAMEALCFPLMFPFLSTLGNVEKLFVSYGAKNFPANFSLVVRMCFSFA